MVMTLTSLRQLSLRKQSIEGMEVEDSKSLLDNSLTSLSWLQNLRVFDLVSPDIPVPLPLSPCSEDESSWESNSSASRSPVNDRSSQNKDQSIGIALSPIRKCLMQSAEFKSAPRKYRSSMEKPPFSYSTLIYLAIQRSKSEMATLNEIYRWIKENFKYYRRAEPGWQNSIRHNLSLNNLFVKVPRSQGKGNYWRVNPDYESILSDGSETLFLEHNYCKLKAGRGRKRVNSHHCYNKGSRIRDMRKRFKSESSTQPADPCVLPGDLDWVSLLNSQKVNCGSCPSQSCRPAFGSPVLGPPDLGHIGEPVICSPLVMPVASEPSVSPSVPLVEENRGALLEEAVLKQDSPPQILPWAESRSQSPSTPHPWFETRETTMHEVRRSTKSLTTRRPMWSPESSWSSASTYSTASITKVTPLLNEACM